MMTCEGCGREGLYLGQYTVCMACTRARQQAVLKRRCVCGNKRRPTEVKAVGSRRWISCHRCLGTIKQIS